MYRPNLRLEAVTRAERTGVIAGIEEAIGAAGGWIQDSIFFSNLSVAIRWGMPKQNLDDLLARFRSIGLKFEIEPAEPAEVDSSVDATELNVSINVSFAC